MCHFLSSAWVFIGLRNEEKYKTGWIVRMKRNGTLQNSDSNYWSLYIVGLYYILTTLSTVGYGDVVGFESNLEFWFQMVVMVINWSLNCIDHWYWLFRILYGENEFFISKL